MNSYSLLPLLSESDPGESAEGTIDPLGLYAIADSLGVRLVPGVRERQQHPRFLTAIAVGLELCKDFPEETVAKDGVSEPWQVFEWYLVEGMIRARESAEETTGLPGSRKAEEALRDRVPLSAARYLKAPAVYGFHGVYRLLARTLGVDQGGRLGETGYHLVETWAEEQGLEGFIGTAAGPGQDQRRQLIDAIRDGLETGGTTRSGGWSGWHFFKEHLGIYDAGKREARVIRDALLNQGQGYRFKVLEFLASAAGQALLAENYSERKFHAELKQAGDEVLASLLDAAGLYETFARLLQDAFDDSLRDMTLKKGKVRAADLARLKSVATASREVPDLFDPIRRALEPFDASLRFVELFGSFAEAVSPEAWIVRLFDHHRRTQRSKPPSGKNSWFETFDDGSVMIRASYLREKGGSHDDQYVHAYRTASLWQFAIDLGMVK